MKSDVLIYCVLICSPGSHSDKTGNGKVLGPCTGEGKGKGIAKAMPLGFDKFFGKGAGKGKSDDPNAGKRECAAVLPGCEGFGWRFTLVCKSCHWKGGRAEAKDARQVYEPGLGSGGRMRRQERRLAGHRSLSTVLISWPM